MKFKSDQERMEYLMKANSEMEKYHHAREKLRKGLLKKREEGFNKFYLAAASVFFVTFLYMPMLGRKIARDDEFRAKYIPSWYDFTVRKPENPWTRAELTLQIEEVVTELHERAAAGEFAPEKLDALERRLAAADGDMNAAEPDGKKDSEAKRRAGWDKIHPGLEEDETYIEK